MRPQRAPATSGPDVGLGEADQFGPRLLEELLDRLLVVPHEALLEQDRLLEPRVEAALDDLGPRLLGLALGLGDVEERLALLLDRLGIDLVTGEVRRLGEGDVDAEVV